MRRVIALVALLTAFAVVPALAATTPMSNSIDISLSVKAPAVFAYSDLTLSATTVTVGQNVTVSVRVDNTGDLTGTYLASLLLDGQSVSSQNDSLGAGGHVTITFIVSSTEIGAHTVAIGGLLAALEVTAAPSSGLPWWAIALVVIIAVVGVFFVLVRGRHKEQAVSSWKLWLLKLVNRFRKPEKEELPPADKLSKPGSKRKQ